MMCVCDASTQKTKNPNLLTVHFCSRVETRVVIDTSHQSRAGGRRTGTSAKTVILEVETNYCHYKIYGIVSHNLQNNRFRGCSSDRPSSTLCTFGYVP